jgi:hypothetical protein
MIAAARDDGGSSPFVPFSCQTRYHVQVTAVLAMP